MFVCPNNGMAALRVDLLYTVFLCVQTVVWLPVFVNFNVCKVLIHAPAHKGSINMVGVCTES